jgi:adenosylmethionine-8-amino-7-oxononanoate aminotransferase
MTSIYRHVGSNGRTGKIFGGEHFDVMPEMRVIGKDLGGSISPIAA